MPLGLGIVEVLRAIPPRIEVAGHGATVRITAGTFDAALDYAREVYDAPVALQVEVRNRFWPRVTVTVTTDPDRAAAAPPTQELRVRAERLAALTRGTRAPMHRSDPASRTPETPVPSPTHDEAGFSMLEEIFAHQEQLRQERARVPAQRHRPD
jgi:hypothetical protein